MTIQNFFSPGYQEHNRARLAHLASLGLPLEGRRVLEVGAGPGDHTGFYVDRRCQIVSTDARDECLAEIKARFPAVQTQRVNMNYPAALTVLGTFDVVHAYGLLYHLRDPAAAIDAMASVCDKEHGLLLLETCVGYGIDDGINPVPERASDLTQAVDGQGCRPARQWVFRELKHHFEFTYITRTQPRHPEFPIDWTDFPTAALSRTVFVASRKPLSESTFSPALLDHQSY